MKITPLLLGAALMFWGWQTGLWIFAVVMALVFEASRLIRSLVEYAWAARSGKMITGNHRINTTMKVADRCDIKT